jgi:hypothetical protein
MADDLQRRIDDLRNYSRKSSMDKLEKLELLEKRDKSKFGEKFEKTNFPSNLPNGKFFGKSSSKS